MTQSVIEVLFETTVEEQQTVKELIIACARATLEAEKVAFDAQIDVTVVDDAAIRELNAAHRHKDAVTDVLSFPLYEFENGVAQEDLSGQAEPDTGRILLGDMVLNYKRACEQAQEYGHSPARECGYLTVHSCLHLLGYDHERGEVEQQQMRAREEEILRTLALTRP